MSVVLCIVGMVSTVYSGCGTVYSGCGIVCSGCGTGMVSAVYSAYLVIWLMITIKRGTATNRQITKIHVFLLGIRYRCWGDQ